MPVTEARSNTSLDKDLMTAFRKMQADATAKGLNIYIASGYRSYDYQVSLYNRYVANDGKTAADTYSSRPGNSEHQTGLCFDLNSIEDSFQYTNEGKWINDNCYKYGFCIRFPKGKDAYTGYQYESWHLRYVGEELAPFLVSIVKPFDVFSLPSEALSVAASVLLFSVLSACVDDTLLLELLLTFCVVSLIALLSDASVFFLPAQLFIRSAAATIITTATTAVTVIVIILRLLARSFLDIRLLIIFFSPDF